jgi:hypothetical protein
MYAQRECRMCVRAHRVRLRALLQKRHFPFSSLISVFNPVITGIATVVLVAVM